MAIFSRSYDLKLTIYNYRQAGQEKNHIKILPYFKQK